MRDIVDRILEELRSELPGLDVTGLDIMTRLGLLAKRYRSLLRSAVQSLHLDVWEFEVLAALLRQGTPYQLHPSRLARLVVLTTGAITNRIDRLEARGLVRREPDPRDRRAVRVCLTADGLELAEQAMHLRSEVTTAAVRSLSEEERKVLAHLLRKLMLD